MTFARIVRNETCRPQFVPGPGGEVTTSHQRAGRIDGEAWSLNVTHHDSSLRGVHRTDAVVVPAVAGSGSFTNGIVRVTVVAGNGRIGAYLSVVDNATGDPTYIAISPQTPAGG